MKIDWKTKLGSRKLWVAVAGFITGVVTLFGMPDSTASQIGGVVLSFGSVMMYLFAETAVDCARAGYDYVTESEEEEEEEDD